MLRVLLQGDKRGHNDVGGHLKIMRKNNRLIPNAWPNQSMTDVLQFWGLGYGTAEGKFVKIGFEFGLTYFFL